MKAVIYVRTSTLEQHPQKQLDDCRAFAQKRGYRVVTEYVEQLSAYKADVERPLYEKIKAQAHSGEVKAVIVWALDRWVRNRDTLLDDVTYLRGCGVKLHSVQESWLEAINIEGSLGKTLQDFLLGLLGSLAEMESQLKSERVKLAYRNRKGKRWGRRSLPQRAKDEVWEYFNKGYTVRQIADHVTYYDKHRNLKKVSKTAVHKIIKEKSAQKHTLDTNSTKGPKKDRMAEQSSVNV